MSTTIKPERVLEKLGGCGRYQILLAGTLHTMKLTVAWSMYNMVLAAAVPQWSCALNSTNTDRSSNGTVVNVSFVKTCVVRDRPCEKFQFDTYMKTMASEVGENVHVYILWPEIVCFIIYYPKNVIW